MQRRDFSLQLVGAGVGLALTGSAQAQGAPREGTHYVRLSPPAPVTLPSPDKKIEVVEFFWYGCQHCYAFEHVLQHWAKKLPADVSFRQVPVAFNSQHVTHQKMFYALEEIGQLTAVHRKVFLAIHQQDKRLTSDAEIQAFAKSNGIDSAKLVHAMHGFGVSIKVNRAKQLADAYKIDGVPALGIHGCFYTSALLAGTPERAVAVADFLIQLARKY